jgi:hypothetical protein
MLRIRRPSLPRHINQVTIESLRVGEAQVDLLFERVRPRGDSVALTDVRVERELDVVLEIPRATGRGTAELPGVEILESTGRGLPTR